MAEKLIDMDKSDRTAIHDQYTTQADKLEQQGDQPCASLREALGICHNCKYCAVTEFEFKGAWVMCNYHERNLNLHDRIVRCNSFMKRGQMALTDMYDLAWIIENDKRKVGF